MGEQDITYVWSWLHDHSWLFALVLMLASLVAAKLVDCIFSRIFKTLTRQTKSVLDDKIMGHLHRPVQLTVVVGAAVLALEALLREHPLKDHVAALLYSILLVLWTAVAIRVSRTIFKALIHRHRGDSALVQALPLFDNLVMIVLMAHGAFWLMSLWDVNATPLLASAGIVTAAVALASKDTLANFFGGVSIFVDRPYRLRDYIILNTGERGEVVNIGIRSTRILTRGDVLITVPNAVMANSKIVNQSGQVPRYRVRARVGVGYASDVDKVEEVLLTACEGLSEILPTPKARVRFREFGDSALVFDLLFWVHDPADQGRLLHEVNRNIHKKLGSAGIEIPFPQRVVHFSEKPPDAGGGAGER